MKKKVCLVGCGGWKNKKNRRKVKLCINAITAQGARVRQCVCE